MRELLQEQMDLDAPEPSSIGGEDDDDDDEEEVQPLFADVVGEQVAVASSGPELAAGRQPARASRGRLEQTSRDRLFLQLAKLPQRFHAEAAGAFGGRSLLELTCAQLAARLAEAGLPASELRTQGYPEHLVQMVKRMMATKGASAAWSES